MLSWAHPQVRAAAVCLVIAVVYLFLWPGRKNPARIAHLPLWQRLVLRWFHSLTWVLIAVACFYWSKPPALAAGAVYIIFLFVMVKARAPIAR